MFYIVSGKSCSKKSKTNKSPTEQQDEEQTMAFPPPTHLAPPPPAHLASQPPTRPAPSPPPPAQPSPSPPRQELPPEITYVTDDQSYPPSYAPGYNNPLMYNDPWSDNTSDYPRNTYYRPVQRTWTSHDDFAQQMTNNFFDAHYYPRGAPHPDRADGSGTSDCAQ